MAVQDWSINPSDNTNINGVNVAEFCPPGNLNDVCRQIAASVRAALPDTALELLNDPSYAAMRTTLGVPASTDALTSLAALVPAADRIPYFSTSGPAAGSLAVFTNLARVLVSATNATDARGVIGAVGVSALSLSNPGYIRFDIPGLGQFQVAWGSFTATGNGSTAINFAAPFPNQAFPVISGTGEASTTAQDNNPSIYSTTNVGFTAWNANNTCTAFYVAVGF